MMQPNTYAIKDLKGQDLLTVELPHESAKRNPAQYALEYAASKKIALSGADLRGIYLDKAVLNDLVLRASDLTGSIIKNSNLDGADLYGSKMTFSRIVNTSAKNSNFDWVDLNRSILIKTNISHSGLNNCSLVGSQIKQSNFEHTRGLVGTTRMANAFIFNTSFNGSEYLNPQLDGAVFLKSNLQSVSFKNPSIKNTEITQSNVDGSDFSGLHGGTIYFKSTSLLNLKLNETNETTFNINGQQFDQRQFALSKNDAIQFSTINISTDEAKVLEMIEAIKSRNIGKIQDLKQEHAKEFGGDFKFELHGRNFSNLDMSGLPLGGLDFSGSNFVGSDLKNTKFTQSVFNGVLFSGVADKKMDMEGVDFEHSNIKASTILNAIVSRGKFNKSNINFLELSGVSGVGPEFQHSISDALIIHKDCDLVNVNFNEAIASRLNVLKSTLKGDFKGVTLYKASVDHSDMSESNMSHINITNSNFVRANLRKVVMAHAISLSTTYKASTLLGADLSNIKAQGTQYLGVNLTNSYMDEATFKLTKFNRCKVDGASAIRTIMIDISHKNTDFTKLENASNVVRVATGIAKAEREVGAEVAAPYLEILKRSIQQKQDEEKNRPRPSPGF